MAPEVSSQEAATRSPSNRHTDRPSRRAPRPAAGPRRDAFQIAHEVNVFDVVRIAVMNERLPVGLAQPDGIVRHEARHDADIVKRAFRTVIRGAFAQNMVLGVELMAERKIEVGALAPQEADAELPERLG